LSVLVGEDHNLVLEVSDSGFGIGKCSLELGALSSGSVKLSGKVVNGSRKLSVLVGEDSNLVAKVGNSGFSIGKSSLKR